MSNVISMVGRKRRKTPPSDPYAVWHSEGRVYVRHAGTLVMVLTPDVAHGWAKAIKDNANAASGVPICDCSECRERRLPRPVAPRGRGPAEGVEER